MAQKDSFWKGMSLIFSFGRQKPTRRDPMANFIRAVNDVMRNDKKEQMKER